jgi:hypothetical protein
MTLLFARHTFSLSFFLNISQVKQYALDCGEHGLVCSASAIPVDFLSLVKISGVM